jgi:hypothetical protein
MKIELEIFSHGQKVWRKNGSHHRTDGYSIDYGNGMDTLGFFVEGKLTKIIRKGAVINYETKDEIQVQETFGC